MKVYLLIHVSYPTQVDGDPVEYNHPIAVYAKREWAEARANNLALLDKAEEYEHDYATPHYAVYELEYYP